MKTIAFKDTLLEKKDILGALPIKVCMHVRGSFRTDERVKREANALLEAGLAVTVIDIERERTGASEENMAGIHVRHLAKPHWFTPTRGLKRLVKSAEKFLICTLAVLKIQADVYHAHDVNALPACYLAAKIHRKQLIFDAHEMPLYEFDSVRLPWLRILLQYLLSRILANCAGIITVSPPIAQEICARYHVSDVSLIRNVPTYQIVTKKDHLRQQLGLVSAVRLVLYQGNLQEDRGLDNLIRAATFLSLDTVLVLMGKAIGDAQVRLEALIASEGVADRVKILPPVPYRELLEWTASADIGVIIYKPELSFNIQMCLPNKLFEYLMAGLPVLATPLDAVADILNTYQVGRIVASLAPVNVAAAINALLSDQAALEQMHHKALQAAQEELCWEKESFQLLDLYQGVITQYALGSRNI